ncbi:MAG: DUF4282 domain-containing protein [Devosia sp.]
MFWQDLRKVLSGPALYRLDGLIGARLVPVFYALGLAAIGLWAVDHLFASFAFNFGQGLWGILEIVVYGPLWLLALRLACELILVFLAANESAAATVDRRRAGNSLIEDLSDALHDLADEDDIIPPTDPAPYVTPGPSATIVETGSSGANPPRRGK